MTGKQLGCRSFSFCHRRIRYDRRTRRSFDSTVLLSSPRELSAEEEGGLSRNRQCFRANPPAFYLNAMDGGDIARDKRVGSARVRG